MDEKLKDKLKKAALKKVNEIYSYNKKEIDIDVDFATIKILSISENIELGKGSTISMNVEIQGVREKLNPFGIPCIETPTGEMRTYLWYGILATKNKLIDKYSVGDELDVFNFFSESGFPVEDEAKHQIIGYDPNKFYAIWLATEREVKLNENKISYYITKNIPVERLETIQPEDLMFVYAYIKVKEN